MSESSRMTKVWGWCLICLYYVLTVISHVKVGGWINGCFDSLSRAAYNNVITVLVICLVAFMSYGIYRRAQRQGLPRIVWWTLAYTALALLMSFCLFFVIHIEAIHFLQYGILAFLMKRLWPSYLSVAILTTLAGAYDELFQYLVLDTRAMYYDFNDVFLDAVGAGMGLIIYWFVGRGQSKSRPRPIWWKRPEWLAIGVTALGLLVAALLGEFTVNLRIEDPAIFTLFKEAPEGFWHYPTGPYARFHILEPITGLLLIGLTVFIYGLLDKVAAKEGH